jgi:hypothetical protein
MTSTIWTPDGQRIAPELPASAFTTYQIVSPIRTHFGPATCEAVSCPNFLHGFAIILNEQGSAEHARAAHYIRHDRLRKHLETRTGDGLVRFEFQPGQSCFAAQNGTWDAATPQHKTRLDRDELYFRRPGDWRGNPTGERPYQHKRPEHWVEDFAENQDRLIDQINKG